MAPSGADRQRETRQVVISFDLPRVRLCLYAKQYEAVLDCGITSVVQDFGDRSGEKTLDELGVFKPYLAAEEFQKWKIQIDIDGCASSWPGLFTKLLSRSVVLKVEFPAGMEAVVLRPPGALEALHPDLEPFLRSQAHRRLSNRKFGNVRKGLPEMLNNWPSLSPMKTRLRLRSWRLKESFSKKTSPDDERRMSFRLEPGVADMDGHI